MFEPLNDVSDYGDGFLLGKLDSFLDESFQITLIAKFSDDVTIIGCTVYIVAF
jgi:hypothetical protein